MRSTLSALLLCGCNAMSGVDCRTADWQQEGYVDALYYGSQPRFEHYAKECNLQDAAAERAYMEGWKAGFWEHQTRASRIN